MYVDEPRRKPTRRSALSHAIGLVKADLLKVEQDMYDAGFTAPTNKFLNRVDVLHQLEAEYYQLELPIDAE